MIIRRELADNPHVRGNGAIQHEIEVLKMKFEPLKDNVINTLELLKRCVLYCTVVLCVRLYYMYISNYSGK